MGLITRTACSHLSHNLLSSIATDPTFLSSTECRLLPPEHCRLRMSAIRVGRHRSNGWRCCAHLCASVPTSQTAAAPALRLLHVLHARFLLVFFYLVSSSWLVPLLFASAGCCGGGTSCDQREGCRSTARVRGRPRVHVWGRAALRDARAGRMGEGVSASCSIRPCAWQQLPLLLCRCLQLSAAWPPGPWRRWWRACATSVRLPR